MTNEIQTTEDKAGSSIVRRPLVKLAAREILSLASCESARGERAIDFLVQAWSELVDERRPRKGIRSMLEEQFLKVGLRPEPWLGRAMRAAQGVNRATRGRHHLYVLVCDGYDEDGNGLGLYVGRSKYKPETRFGQHASGLAENHAARLFRLDRTGAKHKPLALLPSFYEHLNPLVKAEAEVLEVALVEAMIAVGVPASRVGGPRDRSADEIEPEAPDEKPSGDTTDALV